MNYDEADKYLADIMGYATPDYPRWTQKNLTKEQIADWEHERYLHRTGQLSTGEYKRRKDRILFLSKHDYDYRHPRRPPHWHKVVEDCLMLDADILGALTRDDLRDMIEYQSPEAVEARKHWKRHLKDRKADAQRIRQLPENKAQEWNWNEKRNWARTDDAANDNEPVNAYRGDKLQTNVPPKQGFIKRARIGGKRSLLKHLYPSKFGDNDREPDTPAFLRMGSSLGGSGQVSEEEPPVKPSANDNEILNSPEFAENYAFGELPAIGKKISGRSRKLLGEAEDWSQADLERLKKTEESD
jgi:hypothetical protein